MPIIDDTTPLSKLRILTYPDPALRQVAVQVEKIDELVRARAQRMIELMWEAKGIGLAATQIGWPVRLCVLAMNPDGKKIEVFINPEIVSCSGTQNEEEGCLSLPNIRAHIKRPARVVVKAINLDGKEVTIESQGLLARAWQHEVDHLNGRLILHRMNTATRLVNARRLRELEKQYEANAAGE